MFFDSPIYIIFLLLIAVVYWQLHHRWQNIFLLAGSYFFYGWWDWRFLTLMAASTVADFFIGQAISRKSVDTHRRRLMILSVVANLLVLGTFKYFNFFVDSFVEISANLGFNTVPRFVLEIVLPPAISFYTFQELAYVVDVYRGKVRPASTLLDYALFVSFFPHLIAGPIQYPSHLLPQVERPRTFDPSKSFDGVFMIIEGLFRKVVIADSCGLVANAAFTGSMGPPSFFASSIGIVAFAFQIYGDFSGYSCIARGSAQLLGFHFMVNFRQPYFATSIQDFWHRWHISLSTWLREYLYIGLGGNRQGPFRTYRNVFLTMILGGLWHGASWTFVIWGAMHGTFLVLERATRLAPSANHSISVAELLVRRLLVFSVVCIAWVFFRDPTLGHALSFLGGFGSFELPAVAASASIYISAHVGAMLAIDSYLERHRTEYLFEDKPYVLRTIAAALLIVATFGFGANQSHAFIYFQF